MSKLAATSATTSKRASKPVSAASPAPAATPAPATPASALAPAGASTASTHATPPSQGHYYAHPQALVDADPAHIGAGTRVWAFAHVMRGATIGPGCNIGGGAFVEAGATLEGRVTVKNGVSVWQGVYLEKGVFVGPNAVFTNDLRPRVAYPVSPSSALVPTRVGEGASIGANATIRCGLTIGAHAMIGAGAVVVRKIPTFALVVGNPARQIGWVCYCGQTLTVNDAHVCKGCGSRFAVGKTGLESITEPPAAWQSVVASCVNGRPAAS